MFIIFVAGRLIKKKLGASTIFVFNIYNAIKCYYEYIKVLRSEPFAYYYTFPSVSKFNLNIYFALL